VLLSAQTTDVAVNAVTPELFRRWPDPPAMAAASPEEVAEVIRRLGFYRTKSQHCVECAQMIVADYDGEVPQTMAELTRLPGVGRKTANVVGAVLWGREVMPVDTHVFRVAARIGLSRNARTPLATEKQLEAGFPSELLPIAHHWLILHGRYTCTARAPKCSACGIADICRHYATLVRETKKSETK
jgi:endonuclease-3